MQANNNIKFSYNYNDNWKGTHWNEIFEKPFNDFFNNEIVNPWKVKADNKDLTIRKYLSNKYINGNSDFSWIFPWDKKILSSTTNSQKLGIPTQISGNFENANLYLCLFNPSIPNKEANDNKVNKNIDVETYINKGYEDSISIEEYKKNKSWTVDMPHENNVVYDGIKNLKKKRHLLFLNI